MMQYPGAINIVDFAKTAALDVKNGSVNKFDVFEPSDPCAMLCYLDGCYADIKMKYAGVGVSQLFSQEDSRISSAAASNKSAK